MIIGDCIYGQGFCSCSSTKFFVKRGPTNNPILFGRKVLQIRIAEKARLSVKYILNIHIVIRQMERRKLSKDHRVLAKPRCWQKSNRTVLIN